MVHFELVFTFMFRATGSCRFVPVTTQIRSSRTTEDGKTGFPSFKDVFFLVSVVPVVSIASFRSFRWFRFGGFGRFVSVVSFRRFGF